jgi:CRP-like cAMP-binding protein/tRNA A-37 threonylcarbamoyl transferase component Bud32
MSSSVSLSQSLPSSSTENESGVLDDLVLLGTDDNDKKKSGDPEIKHTEQIRTRQRKLGSFVVATKKPKLINKRDDDGHSLFKKRLYTYPTAASTSSSSLRKSIAYSTAGAKSQGKTEVEKAVLTDCIKNHFLLASNACADSSKSSKNESSDLMVGALISRFEKISLRKNEILFEEGSAAEYLHVLYRGEVLLRSRNDRNMIPPPQEGKENEQEDDGDDDDDAEKYKIFGELEVLTNSLLYKATAKAISDSCVLFRLSATDFQTYFLPQHHQKIFQSSRQSLASTSTTAEEQEQLEEEERLLGDLRKALPAELSSYFFQDDDADYDQNVQLWKRLLAERNVRNFRKGDVLIHKSKPVHSLVIITDGLVRATDNTAGGRSYEDLLIGHGKARNSFGWQSVLKMGGSTNDKTSGSSANEASTETGSNGSGTAVEQKVTTNNRGMMGTIRAETDGRAIVIPKKAFEKVFSHLCYNTEERDKHHIEDGQSLLMDVADLRWRRWKRTQLQQIMVFKDSGLDSNQINGLLDLMHRCEYGQEETIIKSGQTVEAAMYFVREGSVRLELNRGRVKEMIERAGYFGEKNMLLDQNKSDSEKHYQKRSVISAISASALTKVDVLYLEECSKVVNTTILGLGMNSSVSSIDTSVQWVDLRRHKLIGTGSFGQVWLASTETPAASDSRIDDEAKTNSESKRRYFALKVQAKYPLVRSGNADRLIAERNAMASLNSPFIMRLFNAFQDDFRLYMITSLVPGGELESALPKNGFSENTARFYAAGILEGLTYMHRKHILHRDVKPENVLLNAKGYPVLIDLGFGKYLLDTMTTKRRLSSFGT